MTEKTYLEINGHLANLIWEMRAARKKYADQADQPREVRQAYLDAVHAVQKEIADEIDERLKDLPF